MRYAIFTMVFCVPCITFFFQNSFSTYNPNFNHNYACFICQSLHESLVRMHSLKNAHRHVIQLFFFFCIAYFQKYFTLAAHIINILIIILPVLSLASTTIYKYVLFHCILRTMHCIFFLKKSLIYTCPFL